MWWSTHESRAFARELANAVIDELGAAVGQKGPKFRSKAERALTKAARRVDEFKAGHRLNWYQRSRTANAFLWTLKDRQCPPQYANELTEWLLLRL